MKIKENAKSATDSTKRIVANSEQFIQAAALLAVASFSYWALTQVHVQKVTYWGVLASLIIIGLRGAYELIKFLDKK